MPPNADPRSGPEGDEAFLASLVGDVRRFAADHWGHRPLHHGAEAASTPVDGLLDVEAVDRILASGPRRPSFRLVRAGVPLDPCATTRPVRLAGQVVGDVADAGRVAEELAAGATLVLQGLHRTWPPVDRFCARLERALGHPVQANAYLTPGRATGLADHVDRHDVLVLQLHGSKAWTVDHLGPVTLEPGDVLYLPAGTRHAARALAATSLHLTVGIHPVTVGQVVSRVLAADPSSRWHDSLPLAFDRTERRATLEGAIRTGMVDAAAALARTEVAPVAAREIARRQGRRRVSGLGRVASVAALDGLHERTVVVLRDGAVAGCGTAPGDDGRLVLELSDRRLRLPSPMGPAVGRLLAGTPVEVGDLPGLAPGDRQVLVRRLVREGVVDVVG